VNRPWHESPTKGKRVPLGLRGCAAWVLGSLCKVRTVRSHRTVLLVVLTASEWGNCRLQGDSVRGFGSHKRKSGDISDKDVGFWKPREDATGISREWGKRFGKPRGRGSGILKEGGCTWRFFLTCSRLTEKCPS